MGIYLESNRRPLSGFELGTGMFTMYIYGEISVYVKSRLVYTEGKPRGLSG